MKKKSLGRDPQALREAYFNGYISVQEYVNKRMNSKEGDRNRRAIEARFKKESERLKKTL